MSFTSLQYRPPTIYGKQTTQAPARTLHEASDAISLVSNPSFSKYLIKIMLCSIQLRRHDLGWQKALMSMEASTKPLLTSVFGRVRTGVLKLGTRTKVVSSSSVVSHCGSVIAMSVLEEKDDIGWLYMDCESRKEGITEVLT
jgi:hypothetical protein